ncbi:MAG TPA: hypothetical protein VIT67_11860 [Povalibacter sp.]
MWRRIRIAILLLILLIVALNTYFDRVYSTDWGNSLRVAVFPINADGSAATERYIQSAPATGFESLESFFTEEGKHYGVKVEQPVHFTRARQLQQLPPVIEPGAGRLSIMLWSLRMRFWAWRIDGPPGSEIKLFVLYHDPQHASALPHSLGMQKGLFGVVHVFADRSMEGSNDTVIAHELLHTLGATDKYGADNLPILPDGYAEPDQQPLYPQSFAELMAGRIPVSVDEAEMPESLRQVVIGPHSAAEIGWTRP